MMKVVKFNLPMQDNNHNTLEAEHAAVQRDLVRRYGGFTATEGLGGWQDEESGNVHVEKVRIYEVALDLTVPMPFTRFLELVRFHGAKCRQLAVYAVDPDNTAIILNLRDDLKVAAA